MLTVKQLCPDPTALGLSADIRGWNGRHPIFAQCVEHHKVTDICEVGCWLGHGTLHLAGLTKGNVYCVDTWLGGYDHLIFADRADCHIPRRHGYPELYQQWLYNIATSEHWDKVIPIPQTSINGARLLKKDGKTFRMIVIDASHEYDDVYADLCAYDGLLTRDGVMVVDDFRTHPGVFHATLRFAHERNWEMREMSPFVLLNRRAGA